MIEVTEVSIAELRAALESGRTSAVELVKAYLARIDAYDGPDSDTHLNAVVVRNPDALKEAEASDARRARGQTLSPLDGIPYSAKDLIETAGVRTTHGSMVFAQNIPAQDAVAVARLRAGGAVLLGKTTTPEFGHKPEPVSPVSGLRAVPLVPQLVAAQQARFLERWREAMALTDGTTLPEGAQDRALTEATAFAIRIDVAEELTRLNSHLDEIERLVGKGGEIGKRLDFLIQELHREANTLGSKSATLEMTRISVDMKVLIEQMREQVQNIE